LRCPTSEDTGIKARTREEADTAEFKIVVAQKPGNMQWILAFDQGFQPGDRIRLVSMQDDPDPVKVGELGTVTGCRRYGGGRDAWLQIDVAWENGRTLMLVSPPDRFEIIVCG